MVIVSFNVLDLLAACLRSVEADAGSLRLEVIVVDNSSGDGSADMVARDFPRVTLIRNPVNRWFAPANNQALRLCRGRHVLFLNPDTEVLPGALAELAGFLDAHPAAGVVGPQLLNSDGSLQPSGNRLRPGWSFVADALPLHRIGLRRIRGFQELGRDYEMVCDVGEVSWAAAMVRHEVLERVGLLDERLPYCYEDVDLCIRARQAGWRVLYYPRARVMHHGGKSRPLHDEELRRRWEDGQLVFIRKHYSTALYAAVRVVIGIKNTARWARRMFRDAADGTS